MATKKTPALTTKRARRRPAKREKRSVSKGSIQKWLATIIVGSWMVIQFFLLTHEIIDSMREIVMRTLGTLDAILGIVVHYFFNTNENQSERYQPPVYQPPAAAPVTKFGKDEDLPHE